MPHTGFVTFMKNAFFKIGRRESPRLGDTRSYWSTGRSVSCHMIYAWVIINNQHTNIINGRSEARVYKKKRAIEYVKFWTLMRTCACGLLLYPRYQHTAAAVGIVGPRCTELRTENEALTNYISIHIIRGSKQQRRRSDRSMFKFELRM